MSDITKHAIDYAVNRGWSVFPVHGVTDDGACTCGNPDCKSVGKHPTTANGFKNASKDRRAIDMFFRHHQGNLAVATGEISGFFVLDVDGQEGELSLTALQAANGDLPATKIHHTGNGRHLFFQWPGRPVPNSVKRLGAGLDVRGDGGYIVIAPSIHKTGVVYRFADIDVPTAPAPEWLLDLIFAKKEKQAAPLLERTSVYEDHQLTERDVYGMLDFINPDCDYETWVNIGMGLHADNWPCHVWDDWSRGGQKYQANDCAKRWRGFKAGGEITFGTVWHYATQAGWSPSMLEPQKSTEPHPAAELIENARKQKPKPAPEPTRTEKSALFDPATLPGLIGDTVRWIVRSSIRPQPDLALLNVLAVLGCIFSRHYASDTDLRTNLYAVGIADTGSGKDHSRKQMKKLLARAGLHRFLSGDNVISAAGILTALEKEPAQIMMLDEFGITLKALCHEKAPSYHQQIVKLFMELFSSANSIYHGGTYASKELKPVIIECPGLSIYGTTTLARYKEALTSTAIADGQLNRFIVLETSNHLPPSNKVRDIEPPESLTQAWATIGRHTSPENGNLQALSTSGAIAAPKTIKVAMDDVEARIDAMRARADDWTREAAKQQRAGLWTRYVEQVIKVAMISAITRNHIAPIMEDCDLDLGERLVMASCDYVLSMADNHISDSVTEKEVKDILTCIIAGGERGVTKSDIARTVRNVVPKRRNEILNDLCDVQKVIGSRQETSPGATKPSTFFWFIG